MAELTKAQRKNYVENGYSHCPKCKSSNIEAGSLEVSDNQVWQDVKCLDCGLEYNDIYTLTSVEVRE